MKVGKKNFFLAVGHSESISFSSKVEKKKIFFFVNILSEETIIIEIKKIFKKKN